MNRDELISLVSGNTGSTMSKVSEILDCIAEVVTTSLVSGEPVYLGSKIGVFKTKTSSEKNVRNPNTGEIITIPERRKVGFYPSKKLKEEMNKPVQ